MSSCSCKAFTAALIFSVLLLFSAGESHASSHEAGVVTGGDWMQTPLSEKQAFLCGIVMTFEMEKGLAEQTGKKVPPLASDWCKAFGGASIASVVSQMDEWLTAHPGNESRHIFDLLWKELVLPTLTRK
ncbi:MAG: hypothetical protein PUB69_01690 [Desulfovibrionaceae bacterium]|nr:hypothetical protein [Desulfovibrionaceae bacterium]